MALIKCPDCGKQVSDQAVACPNCGHPIAKTSPSESSGQKPSSASVSTAVQTQPAQRPPTNGDSHTFRLLKLLAILFLAAAIVAGVVLYNANFGASSNPISGLLRLSTPELQEKVTESIKETLAKKPDTENYRVRSFSLIHKAGNQYDGLLEADVDGNTLQLAVDVTYDGQTFMWKIRP